MVKEVFDRSAALLGLLLLAPLLLVLGFAVWCHDHHSHFYLGRRVGRHGSQFRIFLPEKAGTNDGASVPGTYCLGT